MEDISAEDISFELKNSSHGRQFISSRSEWGSLRFSEFFVWCTFFLKYFSFTLYSDFCQILIDFHGQITGNDDPNEFLAEITQNNRKITVNCLWKSIKTWQKSKYKMKEKISRNKMYSLFLFCQKRIIK